MIAYKLFRMRKDGSLGPWHTLLQPVAPHLSEKNRVWCKVEIEDFEYFTRPVNQGGRWALANRMRVLEICQ